MWQKRFSLWLSVLIIIVLVTACSSSNSGNNGGTDEPGPEPSPTVNQNNEGDKGQEEAEEEPAFDLGGITMRIAANSDRSPTPDTPEGQLRLELQEAVEKKYNVKIEYIAVPQVDYMNVLTTSVLAGEPEADIWWMASAGAVPVLAQKGIIQPVTEYITKMEGTTLNFDQLMDSAGYKGEYYGFGPTGVDAIGIFFNEKIFEDAGMPDPRDWVESKQWTWDKFREVAKQLTKDTNGDGTPDQWGLSAFPGDFSWFLILANNGFIYDDIEGVHGYTSANTLEALELLGQLFVEDKVVRADQMGWGEQRTFFPEGNVAMVPGFSWEGNGFKTSMEDYGWGFLPLPIMPKANDYINPARQMNMFFLAKGTKHPEEFMHIWKELQVWDDELSSENYLANQYEDERDIDLARMLRTEKVKFDKFAGIPGLNPNELAASVARGEQTAAEAIEAMKSEFQSAIETTLAE